MIMLAVNIPGLGKLPPGPGIVCDGAVSQESDLTSPKIKDKVRLCVIDDDERILLAVHKIFYGHDYEVLCLTGEIGTTAKVSRFQPDIILLDLLLPFIRGPELLKLIQQYLKHRPRVILFSSLPPKDLEQLAREMDADDFFYKGDGLHRLLGRINLQAFELNRTRIKESGKD